jgi:hypothetical protein
MHHRDEEGGGSEGGDEVRGSEQTLPIHAHLGHLDPSIRRERVQAELD